MLGQYLPPHLGFHGRRRCHRRAVGAHHLPAERLLLIGAFHHVHLAVQTEIGTCHGESRAPLPCSGFGGHAFQPLLFGIIGLSDGRIQLMAAAGIIAFKFIIYLCRRAQPLLQTVGPNQRRRAVHFIKIADLLRNLKKGRMVVKLLRHQLLAENPLQFLCLHGLIGAGTQERRRFLLHVGPQIVPCLRHLLFIQINFVRNFSYAHHITSL